MRIIGLVAIVVMGAATASAAEPTVFVNVSGGFATNADGISRQTFAEAGVHVTRHLAIFGDFGAFHDLEPSVLAPSIEQAQSSLLNDGLDIAGIARDPIGYSLGGIRVEMPMPHRVVPYAFGGIGSARVRPAASFEYLRGTFPDQSTATLGQDVTSTVVTMGEFTEPAASNALMMTTGAGATFQVARHLLLDAAYRFSRISSDTPMHAQGLNFGIGVAF